MPGRQDNTTKMKPFGFFIKDGIGGMLSRTIAVFIIHLAMISCCFPGRIWCSPFIIGRRIGATFISRSLIHPSLHATLHTFLVTISGVLLLHLFLTPFGVVITLCSVLFAPGSCAISFNNQVGQTCSLELTRPLQKMQRCFTGSNFHKEMMGYSTGRARQVQDLGGLYRRTGVQGP